MGNLHEGHLSLVRRARREADLVAVSIFVNPLQFGANEDLASYPRTLDADMASLEGCECDLLFTPDSAEMIGDGAGTVVHVPGVSENYCGSSRPGHFDGVATIVTKLLSLFRPEVAVFGLKDYQQFLVIRKLVADLDLGVSVIGEEIVREADGLAMSSRNGYLDAIERVQATAIYQSLVHCRQQLAAGNGDIGALERHAKQRIAEAGLKPDYFAICQADTLQPASREDRELVILAAAFLGQTRLIDNLRLTR
jgi:pantoate--beta-alanine ligase